MGTRISEESTLKPKPMIEIGGKPILWHIMKIYSQHEINDFIICCGYKGFVIKEYFASYFLHVSDVTLDIAKNSMEVHQHKAEPWRITLVDTGLNTMTGGRLKAVSQYLDPNEDFCFTYGDGVADIDVAASIKFHQAQGTLATVTAVRPPARFGALRLDGNKVSEFHEKHNASEGWINGGFFVLSPKVADYIDDQYTVWEREPLETLARKNQLSSFRHEGFWQPMDTLRDKTYLEELWLSGRAPWKNWV
jgi:glucose-1-phosphate cytidylyltransferase